jgi:hypothetical protein
LAATGNFCASSFTRYPKGGPTEPCWKWQSKLRALDDLDDLSATYQQEGMPALGTVTQADGSETELYFRDMTNKIMHAGGFSWELANVKDPVISCL